MEKNNKKQNAVIIFLVVIILILVGLFTMFYLKNEDNKTNDKTKVNESVKEQQDNNKKEVISKDKYDEYEKFLKKYSNIQSCYDIFDSYNYEKNTIDNNYLVDYKNKEQFVNDLSKRLEEVSLKKNNLKDIGKKNYLYSKKYSVSSNYDNIVKVLRGE